MVMYWLLFAIWLVPTAGMGTVMSLEPTVPPRESWYCLAYQTLGGCFTYYCACYLYR